MKSLSSSRIYYMIIVLIIQILAIFKDADYIHLINFHQLFFLAVH